MAKAAKKKAPVDESFVSKLEIVDCVQGEPLWFAARLGVPTASRFADVLAAGDGKMRTRYLRDLAGEIMSDRPAENFKNGAMARGNEMEAAGLAVYANSTFEQVTRIGFAKNSGLLRYATVGASPDALVGDAGGVEIKSMAPHLLIDVLDKGVRGFPSEHRAQVQGNIWVFERRWWDLCLYWPGMPRCVFRVERDDAYIAEMAKAVETFCFDLRTLVQRLRAMKGGS